jgi:hypothetical protein
MSGSPLGLADGRGDAAGMEPGWRERRFKQVMAAEPWTRSKDGAHLSVTLRKGQIAKADYRTWHHVTPTSQSKDLVIAMFISLVYLEANANG